MQRAADDLARLDRRVTLRGQLTMAGSDGAPAVLTLLEHDQAADTYTPVAHRVQYRSGPFELVCRPGSYFLLAFEDRNQDLTLQEDERVGWHGTELLVAEPGAVHEDLDLELVDAEVARAAIPRLYERRAPFPRLDLGTGHLGEVVRLDDPRLAAAAGEAGMWEPVRYVEEGNHGVFFLEPYAPHKTPVVFVHGIKGYGAQFAALIGSLDRERYQPWVVQYASGLRLDMVASQLAQALMKLQVTHDFERAHVVAHSMGGLASRATIQALGRDAPGLVDLFVSYSTPWRGHLGAQAGVDWSPTVVPCWYDVAPKSPFLEALFAEPLPDDLPHWLAFGYRGAPSFFVPEQNDGVVTLASQLFAPAQREAHRLKGFDESHATILTCSEGAAFLADALRSVARGDGDGGN